MIFIIITVLSLWVSAIILVEARNKAIRKGKLWRVSNKFPDENMQGQIVRINFENNGLTTIDTVERVQIKTSERGRYLGNGQYEPTVHTEERFLSNQIATNMFDRYLKPVKQLKEKKGGEKQVRRMPRLWKLLIIYIPLAILVWDLVLNANNITSFAVQHFVLIHK